MLVAFLWRDRCGRENVSDFYCRLNFYAKKEQKKTLYANAVTVFLTSLGIAVRVCEGRGIDRV